MAQVEQLPQVELVRWTEGDEDYIVRPFIWDIELADKFKDMFFGVGHKFAILSDDIPRTLEGFLSFVMAPGSIWFEVVRENTGENIGFMYLTDMVRSGIERRYIVGSWHALAWDGKIALRTHVAQEAVKAVFKMFRLHRLTASIPLIFGRTINAAKKIGFKEEGVMRSYRRYNGQWCGVLLLSIVEEDLSNG